MLVNPKSPLGSPFNTTNCVLFSIIVHDCATSFSHFLAKNIAMPLQSIARS